MKSRIASLTLPVATAAWIGLASLPALAGSPMASPLEDGRVHGFVGCLAQEPDGIRYFDLTNAKADSGQALGNVRLTSSVWGIEPKKALGTEVHVNGMYRGHLPTDPAGGHIAVKDAAVVAPKCS